MKPLSLRKLAEMCGVQHSAIKHHRDSGLTDQEIIDHYAEKAALENDDDIDEPTLSVSQEIQLLKKIKLQEEIDNKKVNTIKTKLQNAQSLDQIGRAHV